jgi:hypothetical protein
VKVEPSGIAGVELTGPDATEFVPSVEMLYGRPVDAVLRPALPYSIIARNQTGRTIAFLGIRFDMTAANAKRYAVIHYADTLRHPEKADLTPGATRFVCAEPLYTDLVLRRASDVDQRSRMNLDNLRKAVRIRASVDCLAFVDGLFAGADTNGAFERLEQERRTEGEFVREVLEGVGRTGSGLETLLARAMEEPGRRGLARRLYAGLQAGGLEEVFDRARNYRCRIPLWR